ncbi:MAG: T9SS type A sorting domain-containing protein [Bacteroidetes bacterium]|nr:T9SS type A sorting domain-containing protein [Bacteroidota bacterium]
MKRQLLIAALFLVSLGASAQYTWLSQSTGLIPVSSGVRYISVVDSNIAWISTYDGSGGGANRSDFSRTTDGSSWTAGNVPLSADYDWSMIFGLNADTAWAMFYDATAGAGGGIWKTTDGGANWTQQGGGAIFDANSFPDIVHFYDADNGFAIGDPNPSDFEIYTTSDGGATWIPVPGANIAPAQNGEYAIVGHYVVMGDTIWFDTNQGRVFRSVDRGQNWTVASTGITVPASSAIDLCFYTNLDGIARLYNSTTGANTMKVTHDGGSTWATATPVGNFFGSDVKWVPGTQSTLVSTGAATGFIGSSYSADGGLTWTDIEVADQRTALGISDSIHMWTGGFTADPVTDGIYKWVNIPTIACSDPSISPGVTVVGSDTSVCDNETATFTATGVVAPTTGDFSGVSWVISSADISGTTDPLNDPSLIASYRFTFPAPATATRSFTNDAALIGGQVPYGLYYWTPVVFGNAVQASAGTPVFLGDLTLDPNCTYVGTSVPLHVYDPLSPTCTGLNVTCSDPSITPGTTSVSDTAICDGDTAIFTATGMVAPTEGDYAGESWVITTADISGSTDPLNDPSIVTSYVFNYSNGTSTRSIINDGQFIGSLIPYGVYYWTPVVFGNAVANTTPPTFLQDLNLDPNCTYSGTSVAVNVLDPSDPNCTGVGIAEINASQLAVYSYQKDASTIDIQINAAVYGKTSIQIIDMMGRQVYSNTTYVSKGVNHEMVNAQKLSAGTYLIHVESNGIKAVNKLVKF